MTKEYIQYLSVTLRVRREDFKYLGRNKKGFRIFQVNTAEGPIPYVERNEPTVTIKLQPDKVSYCGGAGKCHCYCHYDWGGFSGYRPPCCMPRPEYQKDFTEEQKLNSDTLEILKM